MGSRRQRGRSGASPENGVPKLELGNKNKTYSTILSNCTLKIRNCGRPGSRLRVRWRRRSRGRSPWWPGATPAGPPGPRWPGPWRWRRGRRAPGGRSASWGWAADAGDLFDDGVDLDPGAQGQGDEAAGGFDLVAGAAAGLAHLGEDLAEAQVVVVHRNVKLAAAGGDQLGRPGGPLGPGPGGGVFQFGLGLAPKLRTWCSRLPSR